MGICSQDVLPQVTKDKFHPSICCGICFPINEGNGLQLCSTDQQHLCKKLLMHLQDTRKSVLRVRKGFQHTLPVLISHENYWWPHLGIAVSINLVAKHSNVKEKEWFWTHSTCFLEFNLLK
jgi:hypothetical protein